MSEFTVGQKEFLEDLFLRLNATIELKSSEIQKEIKGKIEEFEKGVRQQFTILEEKNNILETENKILKHRILNLERRTRKNNVAIFGVDEAEPDLAKAICNIFENKLELLIKEEDLNDVHYLTSTNKSKSPVIVEFISYQKKLLVLKNAKKLKGSNIYIANDQCIEDRNKNKILIQHLKKARSKGVPAYIKGNRLYISNEPYTVEQLERENLEDPEEVYTQEEIRKIQEPQPVEQVTSSPKKKIKRSIEEHSIEDQNDQKKQKAEDTTKNRKINTRSNSTPRNK